MARVQLLGPQRAQRWGGPHRESSPESGASKSGPGLHLESVWPRSAETRGTQHVRMSARQEHDQKSGSSRTRHGGAPP